jgi:hypothetical protein
VHFSGWFIKEVVLPWTREESGTGTAVEDGPM